MNELFLHKLTFKILSPAVRIFLKFRFNYVYDDLSRIEGPYLLLANHNLELDPALVGVAAGKQLYFVASEHILRKGLGTWFLMTFFKPIIHMKGRQGLNTVKEMLKTLKSGQSVCIFPEGNRSFNGLTGEILPSIGKVARKSGAKLVTYRLEGGYLSQPRWSTTLRKGKLRGRLIREYSIDELKSMTEEQLNEAICRDLYEDAYETQKREKVAFKGKSLALGMETTIFACPSCGRMGGLHTDSDHLYCDCGFKAKYDAYGELTDDSGRKYTVTQLDSNQQRILQEQTQNWEAEEEPLFSDAVTACEIDKEHALVKEEAGSLNAYKWGFECCGRRLPYDQLMGMAIYSRNAMILHVNGMEGHLEIKADKVFCALKYLYLYKFLTEKKGKVQ